MKKYLFLLAFILPFMAIGQSNTTHSMMPGTIKVSSDMTSQVFGDSDSGYTSSSNFTINAKKDSIVKGYIFYVKKYPAYRQVPTMTRIFIMEGHQATEHYHEVMVEEATQRFGCEGCYTLLNANDGMTSYHKVLRMQFYKIVVDGKPFDLNKYYQFIPENQVVE